MPKSLPPIHESHEELLKLFNTMPDRERRNRVHALFIVKMGYCRTRKAIATALDVERKTVERWFKLYEQAGLQSLVISHRDRCGKTPRIQGDVLSQLNERLTHPEGFHGYQSICAWLKEQHGLDVPYTTVHATVSVKLKARPKVARKSNVKKDPFHEELFKKKSLRNACAMPNTRTPKGCL